MNILDTIVAQKKIEVATAKNTIDIRSLEKNSYFASPTISIREKLSQPNNSGVIAEFKRQSPSKGIINNNVDVITTTLGYQHAGAIATSILTDIHFFGGTKHDLIQAREQLSIPILRKDFMIDEYQFIEAKSWGADIVLLIAAILSPQEVKSFTDLAQSLGLQVLLELHDESELNHVYHKVDMIGINNRNLKTFEVDIEQSIRMANRLSNDFITVAESGISNSATLKLLRANGFGAFLIGENFMKSEDPAQCCKEFIAQL